MSNLRAIDGTVSSGYAWSCPSRPAGTWTLKRYAEITRIAKIEPQ
jgi:hypothetical protein